MKTTFLISALCSIIAVSNSTATVVFLNASAGGAGAEDSSGIKYTNGTATFASGFFTNDGTAGGALLSNAQITSLGANPAALDAAFVEIGSSNVFENGGDGLFGDSFEIADIPADAGALPLTTAQYTSLFNNGATMYAYIQSATEVGVWDSGVGLLDPGTVGDFNNQVIANFNGLNVTSVVGTTDVGGGTFFGDSLRTTAIIPEPSAFGLLGLSAVGLLLRRKRRS